MLYKQKDPTSYDFWYSHILGLRARMWDPYAYVVVGAPMYSWGCTHPWVLRGPFKRTLGGCRAIGRQNWGSIWVPSLGVQPSGHNPAPLIQSSVNPCEPLTV